MKIIKVIIMACLCTNITLQAQGVNSNVVDRENSQMIGVEQISDSTQLKNISLDDIEKKILVQRIDSLEKELSYVKLQNELNALKTELQVNVNNLDIKSNSILLNVNSKTFLRMLYNAYKEHYESSEELVKSYQPNVDLNKMNCYLHILKYNYSEKQESVLEATNKVIDNSYSKLKSSLDYYKTCLDMYRDNL